MDSNQWPVFTVGSTKRKVAVNPNLVSAVYQGSEGLTEIYTLDCARDKDCWDVVEDFDTVLQWLGKIQ